MQKRSPSLSVIICSVSVFWILVLFLLQQYQLSLSIAPTSEATSPVTAAVPSMSFRTENVKVGDKYPKNNVLHMLAHRERIAVIIRSHIGYKDHLLSLLWALQAQDLGYNMHVIIAPTEFESVAPLEEAVSVHWPKDIKGLSVRVLRVDKSDYDAHCCHLEEICTDDWRRGKMLRNWSTSALNTYCSINSPLHYAITDLAVSKTIDECHFCEYLLVTNADNYYSPKFMKTAVSKLEDTKADMVLVDMVHRGALISCRVESGYMDLGGVLSRLSMFSNKAVSFSSLIPENAEPQDWHDADFWMVYNLQQKYNRRITFVREALFVHN